MIPSKITEIEQKIKGLDSISGFKKSIIEYNKICKDIETCKSMISKFESQINDICSSSNKDNCDITTDDEFSKEMEELNLMCEHFNELDLDNQIEVYKILLKKINKCDLYLTNLKMDIIYL